MCSQAGVGCGMMTRLFRFVGLKRNNKKKMFAVANGTKMKIKNKSKWKQTTKTNTATTPHTHALDEHHKRLEEKGRILKQFKSALNGQQEELPDSQTTSKSK
jgi:hypothetical protein